MRVLVHCDCRRHIPYREQSDPEPGARLREGCRNCQYLSLQLKRNESAVFNAVFAKRDVNKLIILKNKQSFEVQFMELSKFS